jgi:hypothetical protein
MLKISRSKETSQIAVVTGSKRNGDNLKNIRREASRKFRNKKRKYLRDKISELATNSKNRNIRNLYKGINNVIGGTNLEVTW